MMMDPKHPTIPTYSEALEAWLDASTAAGELYDVRVRPPGWNHRLPLEKS